MANQGKTIRLPVYLVDKIARMNRVSSKLHEELGREPSDEELGEEMELPTHKIARLRSASFRPVALDAPLEHGNPESLANLIPDEDGQNPREQLEQHGRMQMLSTAIRGLTPREFRVLSDRFGLEKNGEQTLEELGAKLGLTRERVRQIQNGALTKLRRRMEEGEAVQTPSAKTKSN